MENGPFDFADVWIYPLKMVGYLPATANVIVYLAGTFEETEHWELYMDVSENRGTPKSSILVGFSIINHPFWGTPIFGNTHIDVGDQHLLLHQSLDGWIFQPAGYEKGKASPM